MAQELQLREGVIVKRRGPVAVALLTVVTLGIYSYYWYYKVIREMRDFGRSREEHELADLKPWLSLLAISVGGWIVLPQLVTFVRTARRVQLVEHAATGTAQGAIGLTALFVTAVVLPLDGCMLGAATWFVLGGLIALAVAVGATQGRLNAAWAPEPED